MRTRGPQADAAWREAAKAHARSPAHFRAMKEAYRTRRRVESREAVLVAEFHRKRRELEKDLRRRVRAMNRAERALERHLAACVHPRDHHYPPDSIDIIETHPYCGVCLHIVA